jgi:hypothetical protein
MTIVQNPVAYQHRKAPTVISSPPPTVSRTICLQVQRGRRDTWSILRPSAFGLVTDLSRQRPASIQSRKSVRI